jgi:hypothetical protein
MIRNFLPTVTNIVIVIAIVIVIVIDIVIVPVCLPSHKGIKAQVPLVRYDSVAVSRDGISMPNPWAGGLNCPQFSQIDLDGDGKKDLVAFERNFYGSVKTFLNIGAEGEARYVHAPEYQANFPAMRNWMLLRDYNCDGREDIFTSVPAGLAVYRNDSGPGPGLRFTLVTPLLQTFGLDGQVPLYVSPPDIPAIDDIDGDGDLDILTFNIIGSTVEYHKNLSMENTGTCDELEFELRNACWGFFSEDGNNNNVTLFDTCDINISDPEKTGRHAGSTILSIDLDGNGAKDLLLGDITYNNLVMLHNGGNPAASIMTEQETGFPSNDLPVDITVFPASYHLDIDNDGLKDLLVAPNNPNTSENYDNVWYYRNTGTPSLIQFSFRQDDFLQEGMIDLGERSFPAFLDENNDGLTDIIAGSYGYFESAGNYISRLMLLRNTGSPSLPAFQIIDDDYAGLEQYGFDGIYPAFGDMDRDGDMDMIIGDEEGHLHYFENMGGPGNPSLFELREPNYQGIDAGQSAKPQVVDVDRDGLPDLLVGERSGTVKYFENRGSPALADFTSIPTIEQFGGIDVMPECCTGYSAPFMTEDSLGQYVLYVGSEQGVVYLYNNIENNLQGTFNRVDSLYLHGVNVNLSGTDIDQDGRLEFVFGEFAGGMGLLKYGIPQNLGAEDLSGNNDLIRIFPNPADDVILVEIPGFFYEEHMEINILNMFGQDIYHSSIVSMGNLRIDISGLTQGFYLISLISGEKVLTGKFIKQ